MLMQILTDVSRVGFLPPVFETPFPNCKPVLVISFLEVMNDISLLSHSNTVISLNIFYTEKISLKLIQILRVYFKMRS
jgi:hypothetical protein